MDDKKLKILFNEYSNYIMENKKNTEGHAEEDIEEHIFSAGFEKKMQKLIRNSRYHSSRIHVMPVIKAAVIAGVLLAAARAGASVFGINPCNLVIKSNK